MCEIVISQCIYEITMGYFVLDFTVFIYDFVKLNEIIY